VLIDMTPRLPSVDTAYSFTCDAIRISKGLLENTLSPEPSDFTNSPLGQLCRARPFTPNHSLGVLAGKVRVTSRAVASPPAVHISHVVALRAEVKVGRIAAQRVVAVMQNHESCGDCAELDCIGHAVRAECLGFDSKQPIASVLAVAAVCRALPVPALLSPSSLNVRPESVNIFVGQRGNGKMRLSHDVNLHCRFAMWTESLPGHEPGCGSFIIHRKAWNDYHNGIPYEEPDRISAARGAGVSPAKPLRAAWDLMYPEMRSYVLIAPKTIIPGDSPGRGSWQPASSLRSLRNSGVSPGRVGLWLGG